MFRHKGPCKLAIVNTTVFGTPPGARLHFGDAIVVDEDDSDDSHGEQAVQSLDTSCESFVASLRSLGNSMFLPAVAGIDFDPENDGPDAAGSASATRGESSLGTIVGAAGEDTPTGPRDEPATSGQEGLKESCGVS